MYFSFARKSDTPPRWIFIYIWWYLSNKLGLIEKYGYLANGWTFWGNRYLKNLFCQNFGPKPPPLLTALELMIKHFMIK